MLRPPADYMGASQDKLGARRKKLGCSRGFRRTTLVPALSELEMSAWSQFDAIASPQWPLQSVERHQIDSQAQPQGCLQMIDQCCWMSFPNYLCWSMNPANQIPWRGYLSHEPALRLQLGCNDQNSDPVAPGVGHKPCIAPESHMQGNAPDLCRCGSSSHQHKFRRHTGDQCDTSALVQEPRHKCPPRVGSLCHIECSRR